MMAKMDETDDAGWVVVVGMRRAVLEALVQVSTKPSCTVTLYCLCAFPSYYLADGTVKTDDDSQDVTLCKVTGQAQVLDSEMCISSVLFAAY
jgi:hypothetical protein